MEKEKYLYGAAIQGIQGFIFKTDELKDIVGASELVESICTEEFNEFGSDSNQTIVKAAGNIKYVFSSKHDCEKAVLEFPKKVMEVAPGISVSQAVVGFNTDDEFADAVTKLEEKLKAQRNKQQSTIHGFMSMRRSRHTGNPVVKKVKEEYLDAGTFAKRETSFNRSENPTMELSKMCFGINEIKNEQIAYNIEDITSKNDWIAIIHADGNGLGQVVQKVGNDKDKFREFSTNLNTATKEAAVNAYNSISDRFDPTKKIPIRPIVLGGDDFTVICSADFAVEYTQKFLEEFEKTTEKLLGELLIENNVFQNNAPYLTACAGIAFIKSSYPFHYGYGLAEELCKEAKTEARKGKNQSELTPSCLMFHKVQDSFVENFKYIEIRELTAINGASFKYGPYYLKAENSNATVVKLIENVKLLDCKEGSSVKSHLREWLSDMLYDTEMAQQKLERLKSNIKSKQKLLGLVNKATETAKIAAYDILSLHSIMYNQTKEDKYND